MKHIVCVSGGKDSTALALWANENLGQPGPDWTPVHELTHWEAKGHDAYMEYLNREVFDGHLLAVNSRKYPDGFVQLVVERGRVPSTKARFCTEELKTNPCAEYIRSLDDEVTVYLGHRAEESDARACMAEFSFDDRYDAHCRKPLLTWSARDVFAIATKYGIEANPLYKMGAARVGCFPCVMVQLRELKALAQYQEQWVEIKRRVLMVEQKVGSSFFPPNYIPKRFQTGRTEEGKSFPWGNDVFRYVEGTTENQMPLLERRSCMSVYNLCE